MQNFTLSQTESWACWHYMVLLSSVPPGADVGCLQPQIRLHRPGDIEGEEWASGAQNEMESEMGGLSLILTPFPRPHFYSQVKSEFCQQSWHRSKLTHWATGAYSGIHSLSIVIYFILHFSYFCSKEHHTGLSWQL